MTGFVVYRNHDGWFHWASAEIWDSPTFKLNGERVDTRVEFGRYETKDEGRNVRHAYNMMVHGAPTNNPMYNRLLKDNANGQPQDRQP